MANTTEQELLFKERTGEEFSFFYEKFNPRLIYYINNITKDEHLAEDVATDAFIKAFEKIEQYEKDKAQFSTWLFTIGRHLALQELKQGRKTMSIDSELDDEGTTLKDFIQEDDNNDEFLFVLNNKKTEILKREIEKLKQPYRNVIEMREIQRMQYKEIACAMGKDVNFKLTIGDDATIDLPVEISKCYRVMDKYGNEVEFELIKGEQFYEQILIERKGTYEFFGREPKNLSTIKSQIRNSRNLLIESSKKEFSMLDEMYL